jgi:uncharacterized protein
MEASKSESFGVVLFALLLIVAGAFFLPLDQINWGKLTFDTPRTITVVGEAYDNVVNEKATFSAGVTSINDDKNTAVAEVNDKVEAIIKMVTDFGVEKEDIKTQNLNIYQNQEQYYEDGRQKQRAGQWNVNNSVEITLRNVEKASSLADLLATSGATNVWGPNFSLDDNNDSSDALVKKAIEDASEKASKMAIAAGATLGKVLSVNEASSPNIYPMTEMMMGKGGGGGAPVEPGTSGIGKSVTVVFELK